MQGLCRSCLFRGESGLLPFEAQLGGQRCTTPPLTGVRGLPALLDIGLVRLSSLRSVTAWNDPKVICCPRRHGQVKRVDAILPVVSEEHLLASLRDRVIDDDYTLASLLRTCLLLGAQTGSDLLRQWADRELRGYGDDDVPLLSQFGTLRAIRGGDLIHLGREIVCHEERVVDSDVSSSR